jgi:hypothetical protein
VWHYSAQGVSASGTLTTTSQPVQGDFYQVLSINGSRGRQPIDKLIPPGQAIPLNTDYPVDNLIDRNGQLTGNGIGFEITGGRYANVFTKITDKGSVFLEVFTMPSGAVYKEHPIHFQAHLQRTLHPANIVTP